MDVIEIIAGYINDNKIEEALQLISENEEILNDNPEFWNLKGILCIKAKEYKTAINCLNNSLKINENYVDALYNLAYAYELNKDYFNANRIYNSVLVIAEDEELRDEINQCIDKINRNVEENCEIIIKNTDDKLVPEPGDSIYDARQNVSTIIREDNAPLVSIYVLAYNNFGKYTKTCIECILKYTTNIDYELILVDNGSSDETLQYFKMISHPRKKIVRVTQNVGVFYGSYLGYVNCRGKYLVAIPNDVYVTQNWLSNMLKCALSDEKIGMINPVCDYVSNLQSVDLSYTDFNDMQEKAAAYNVSDPRKWEERLRLITLGTMFKRECLDIVGFMDHGFFHDFGDDDVTFRIRRAGYKAILCKDTFICHAGKITDKGVEISRKSLEIGKKNFNDKYYGIDAWDDVNYEPIMMQFVKNNGKVTEKDPRILGIDVACGGPILEVKNKLRNMGTFNSRLSAFSTEAKYWLDLKTICDDTVEVDRIDFITEHFYEEKFDYIVIGQSINKYKEPYKLLSQILKLLNDDGQLLLKLKNVYDISTLLKILGITLNENIESLCYISVDEIDKCLREQGYFIQDLCCEPHRIGEETKEYIKNLMGFKTENDYNKALVNDYILNIVKSNK